MVLFRARADHAKRLLCALRLGVLAAVTLPLTGCITLAVGLGCLRLDDLPVPAYTHGAYEFEVEYQVGNAPPVTRSDTLICEYAGQQCSGSGKQLHWTQRFASGVRRITVLEAGKSGRYEFEVGGCQSLMSAPQAMPRRYGPGEADWIAHHKNGGVSYPSDAELESLGIKVLRFERKAAVRR